MTITDKQVTPCPFCGSTRITVQNIRDGAQPICKDCRAQGAPIFDGPEGRDATFTAAWKAWNTRAALKAADRVAADAAQAVAPTAWMPTESDLPTHLTAAKRVHVVPSGCIDNWFVGYGKDSSCQIEGSANHWFWLAYLILGLVDVKDTPYSEDKALPFSAEYVRDRVLGAATPQPPADDARDAGHNLLRQALAAMTALRQGLESPDKNDGQYIFNAGAVRAFVDEQARLMFEEKRLTDRAIGVGDER